ncbi:MULTISPECIES: hypothetical protein [Pseudomonas]|uniref:Uncharacterized protein n=2 Tax=Pseudomonas TaxID=286 RepID=A0ABT5PYV6_9PSED|nr:MULTISPECIES: hypothetical protein [Pseudomonas]MBS7557716.1 hypothetical protein [Pseudomonas sp. RC4D1]MBW8353269.1 hypothetical protein [Pseudomonas sp.]MCO7580089.1 hypothetical protein [Pseudomonas protegens]MCO7586188.1 hypothetical protein [Pseudomonas chlororaphis]MCO7603302.1 hypothetical protein [Pseudomonas chlororaphis]
MSVTTPPQRSVQPEDWFAAYFIGVTAMAVILALLIMLAMLASAGSLNADIITQTLFVGLLTLVVSGVLIGIITALPCALFFWLAQRFAWRNVLIYLFCGALAAMPTIPVVASLVPSSFYTDRYEDEPLPDGLPRYLPLAPLFGCSGAFLGLVFWWRSGRHLRRSTPQHRANRSA